MAWGRLAVEGCAGLGCGVSIGREGLGKPRPGTGHGEGAWDAEVEGVLNGGVRGVEPCTGGRREVGPTRVKGGGA